MGRILLVLFVLTCPVLAIGLGVLVRWSDKIKTIDPWPILGLAITLFPWFVLALLV